MKRHSNITNATGNFTVKDMVPVSIVEYTGFKHLFKVLGPICVIYIRFVVVHP